MSDYDALVLATCATLVLMCKWGDFHEKAEELLGRPIMSHEFADLATIEALKKAAQAELKPIMNRETPGEHEGRALGGA